MVIAGDFGGGGGGGGHHHHHGGGGGHHGGAIYAGGYGYPYRYPPPEVIASAEKLLIEKHGPKGNFKPSVTG